MKTVLSLVGKPILFPKNVIQTRNISLVKNLTPMTMLKNNIIKKVGYKISDFCKLFKLGSKHNQTYQRSASSFYEKFNTTLFYRY